MLRNTLYFVCCLFLTVLTAKVNCAQTTLTPFTLATTNDPETPLYQQANQILTVALQELGFQLNIITLPNKRSLSWANIGKVDGELFRIKNLDLTIHPNLEQVSEAIAHTDQSVIGPKNLKVAGWPSMKNYTLAYERGTEFLNKNQAKFKAVILVNDFHQALELIHAGRADITITSRATAERFLNRTPSEYSDLIVHSPALIDIELHTYINKTLHPQLAFQLAAVLKQMKLDGRFDQLSQINN
ncbi:substrate-binding periplasmic protein [Pseudoalteromonas tunicata]|jgi:polar amino acid transport system substrate-binding protein|uniref:Uncharacterized protein n=1 Tax=Pseudoalteromonas tunicata D2 TaxID=87626 RepID=A4C6M3_9GAMM|nr:transporter substrate-binding domain-containing protein [Pseudoalteromonas tunicata]ATC95601.1 hypothetical protein PTUN_a3233 [Pseudoalteromonas tunicata]AXT31170.1 hypothetical protein D1819_10370 [Pseudoalteromonas tunicata]EAR29627.1 hypothetical protein PTD2_12444 [Pseudoalteromonas tunicata D2]